jgi:hypothetical protein
VDGAHLQVCVMRLFLCVYVSTCVCSPLFPIPRTSLPSHSPHHLTLNTRARVQVPGCRVCVCRVWWPHRLLIRRHQQIPLDGGRTRTPPSQPAHPLGPPRLLSESPIPQPSRGCRSARSVHAAAACRGGKESPNQSNFLGAGASLTSLPARCAHSICHIYTHTHACARTQVRIGGGVYPEIKEKDYLSANVRALGAAPGAGPCWQGRRGAAGAGKGTGRCRHTGAVKPAVCNPGKGSSPPASSPHGRGSARLSLCRAYLSPTPPAQGEYRIDAEGNPIMLKSLMYKLSYYE